jgi:hypothetical protein
MVELLHNLQLSILVSLVLIHLLDGYLLVILVHCGLENDTERAISNNTVSIVSETSWLLVLFFSFGIRLFVHI